MFRLFVCMFILMVMVNGIPVYHGHTWGDHTYRFMGESLRFESTAQKCQEYFGDSWALLRIESYDEFEMIYDKADDFLNNYFNSYTDYNHPRSIWAGFRKQESSSYFDKRFKFQDGSNDEFGEFQSDTVFNLNPAIFTDLPTDKTGIDLWGIRYRPEASEDCASIELDRDFPSVLNHIDCTAYRYGLPYICEGREECPPINDDYANGGRCASEADGRRCNRDLRDYAIYCNEYNGWCGNTPAHEHAQLSDRYDWHPTSCIYESGIGADNNIYYLSKYPLSVTSILLVVLILLNVFCIIMYICNKTKNKSMNKYKTVSMTDSDTEIPLQK